LFFIDPAYIPAPIIITALFLSILNTYRYRDNLSLSGLGIAIMGRVPGSIVGGLLLVWVDAKQLSLWLGVSVLIAVLISLLRIRFNPTPRRLFLAGFFSGFMGTSSSIGGPPMALLLQHQEANLLRANLSAFFVVSCIMSLVIQATAGYLSAQHIMLALPLVPSAILGYLLAGYWAHRINKKHIRILSLLLCSVAGVLAIINYWL
jgi:uncharacterized membrane protein YfcA